VAPDGGRQHVHQHRVSDASSVRRRVGSVVRFLVSDHPFSGRVVIQFEWWIRYRLGFIERTAQWRERLLAMGPTFRILFGLIVTLATVATGQVFVGSRKNSDTPPPPSSIVSPSESTVAGWHLTAGWQPVTVGTPRAVTAARDLPPALLDGALTADIELPAVVGPIARRLRLSVPAPYPALASVVTATGGTCTVTRAGANRATEVPAGQQRTVVTPVAGDGVAIGLNARSAGTSCTITRLYLLRQQSGPRAAKPETAQPNPPVNPSPTTQPPGTCPPLATDVLPIVADVCEHAEALVS